MCRNEEKNEEIFLRLLGTCPALCQRRKRHLGAYYIGDLRHLWNFDVIGGFRNLKPIQIFKFLRNLSKFLPDICWEVVAEEIYFSVFCFAKDVWPGVWPVSWRLKRKHTTYKTKASVHKFFWFNSKLLSTSRTPYNSMLLPAMLLINFYFIIYSYIAINNTITNHVHIIYELCNFGHMLGVV